MSLSITQKDLLSIWRSPLMWLVLSVVSFIAAWLLWQMIDRYVNLQASFSALPNPPNITQTLWSPFVLTVAKLMMLVIAMTTGLALAQERSQQTLWYLMINKQSLLKVVWAKFKAQMVILVFAWLLLASAIFLIHAGGDLIWFQVVCGVIGLSLFLIWLIALGLMLSAAVQTTGTAVLLNVLVFTLFWLLGAPTIGQGYGLNWLQLLSPVHHLQWFCDGEISLSSLVYFMGGAVVFLLITAQSLQRVKSQ